MLALLCVVAFGTGVSTLGFLRRPVTPVQEVPSLLLAKGPFVHTVSVDGVLKAVKSTPVNVPGNDLSFKIGWLADDGSFVKKGDVIARFDPTEMKKQLDAGEAEKGTVSGRMGKRKVETAALTANLGRDVEQARDERHVAESFQGKDPALYSRHEIIESEIDVGLASQREDHAESSRTVRSALSRAELELLGIDRAKAELKIGKARRVLDSLEVVAPHDGLMVFQRNWRGELPEVGQNVYSGRLLAELPDTRELQAEVWILEADAGGVVPGKVAEVQVEGKPDLVLSARVTRVDSLANPRIRGNPVQYFGATLSLSRSDPATMKPGQRVSGVIHLEKLESVVSVPRQAVFDVDGRRSVYKKGRDGFSPVAVELGAAGLGRVVITKGVTEGDVIALADPTGRSQEPGKKREETKKQASAQGPGQR